MIPMPSTWARASLSAIGYESVSIPYWVHGVMAAFALRAPTNMLSKYRYNGSKLIRKIALRKKEQAAASGKPSNLEDPKDLYDSNSINAGMIPTVGVFIELHRCALLHAHTFPLCAALLEPLGSAPAKGARKNAHTSFLLYY